MLRYALLGVALTILVPIWLVMFKPNESFRSISEIEKSYRGAGIMVAGTDCAPVAAPPTCPIINWYYAGQCYEKSYRRLHASSYLPFAWNNNE